MDEIIKPKAKKTNRLEEIINISINTSSIAASKVLKKNIADVSKSIYFSLYILKLKL